MQDQQINRNVRTLAYVVLAIACSYSGDPLRAQAPAEQEAYHDFRNKRPLTDTFRLRGLDPENESKPENEGLRVTLPAERDQHFLWEAHASTPPTGDFEFTATYQILSAKPPLKGYGVGVNLTISTVDEPMKFGKLCRVLRAKEGSVHLAESWPKFRQHSVNTEAMGGQLRLARIGAVLHYLVSDGPGKDFQQIWEVKDYGASDIGYAGFQVSDSGEPGNPVDARLIDLRLRLGKIESEKLTTASPLAASAPNAEVVPLAPRSEEARPRSLIALVLFGAGVFALLLVVGIVVLMRRRKKGIETSSESVKAHETQPAETFVVACANCGKKLKAKAEALGKKVKCPKCGKAVLLSAP